MTNLAFAQAASNSRIEYFFAKQDWNALVKIGQPAVPRLLAALSDKDEGVRRGSIQALGQIGDQSAIAPLVVVLVDDKPQALRLEAADALVRLGYAPEGTDNKVALWLWTQGFLLPHSYEDFNAPSLKVLTTLPEVVPSLSRLVRQLKANEEYLRASEAAYALARIGGISAVDTLMAVADGHDRINSGYANVAPDHRLTVAAVESLGEIGDPRAVGSLIKLLDPAKGPLGFADVWSASARALGKLGDARAAASLGKVLDITYDRYQYDTDYRPTVCEALVKLGAASIEPLVTALKNSDARTRELASGALGEIGDNSALRPLSEVLNDEESSVRRGAIGALGKLKDQRAVDLLIGTLKDPDRDVRISAVTALGQFRDQRAIDPLVSMLKDPDSNVRESVANALETLGWKP